MSNTLSMWSSFFDKLNSADEFVGCTKVADEYQDALSFVTVYLTPYGWELTPSRALYMTKAQALQFKIRGGNRVWIMTKEDLAANFMGNEKDY